jgi:hypothetical protein
MKQKKNRKTLKQATTAANLKVTQYKKNGGNYGLFYIKLNNEYKYDEN